MEWILIEERIPDKSGQYLVTNGAAIVITSFQYGHFFGIGFPTHWMPLPELPKK